LKVINYIFLSKNHYVRLLLQIYYLILKVNAYIDQILCFLYKHKVNLNYLLIFILKRIVNLKLFDKIELLSFY
ncbi:hypothetical protein B6C91_11365, partial [Gilliamella apicola]